MTELVIALCLVAGVIAAHEIGFRLGTLIRPTDEAFDRQVALVRTSAAALVAFLIGFAFSGAASRFIDR
jgi:2-methylcitrate dehydratase PrpD